MTLHIHSWEQTLQLRAEEAYAAFDFMQAPENHDADSLARAYSACESMTSEHSRSFFMASGLLPHRKSQAARALYAFCRVTDDIVDEAVGDPLIGLQRWRLKVEHGQFSAEDLVPLAWTDTHRRYKIPPRYMTQLIDGVARDLRQTHYETFDDLASYAYGVASTVGLMSMHIIGFESEEAIPYAIKLGVALQVTNILRDVGTDWRMGRRYLPQDELDAFNITDDHFESNVVDERWRAFMRFQIERNRRLYEEAWPGIALLNKDGRLAIAAAADLYRAILGDIETHDYDVFTRRAFIGKFDKLRRLPGLWWNVRGM